MSTLGAGSVQVSWVHKNVEIFIKLQIEINYMVQQVEANKMLADASDQNLESRRER